MNCHVDTNQVGVMISVPWSKVLYRIVRKSTQVVSEECAGTDGTQVSQVDPVDTTVTYGYKYTMRTATSTMSQPLSLLAMRRSLMSHVTSSDIKGSQLSKLKYQLCHYYALLRVARLHRYYFYKLDTTIGGDRKITSGLV